MCNTFTVYFQRFATFGYKKVKNPEAYITKETNLSKSVAGEVIMPLFGNEKEGYCRPGVPSRGSVTVHFDASTSSANASPAITGSAIGYLNFLSSSSIPR